jgi:hypothetical protein
MSYIPNTLLYEVDGKSVLRTPPPSRSQGHLRRNDLPAGDKDRRLTRLAAHRTGSPAYW